MTTTKDTQTAVEAMTKGLSAKDRAALAEALRDALAALPQAPGRLDAGLRRRFTEAADLIESYPMT